MKSTGANPLQDRKKQLVKETLPYHLHGDYEEVKIGVTDDKSKKAAKKALVDIEGFSSYTLDFDKSTLVMTGDMDPTKLVINLRKFVSADLMTFGPEKDERKPQKNNGGGGGGNVDQKPQQKPPPVNPPPGPFVHGYPYHHG